MSPELDDLTPEAAKAILRMRLSKADVARVIRLSSYASEGTLTDAQRGELELYLQIGDVITIMHSKARVALKRALQRHGEGAHERPPARLGQDSAPGRKSSGRALRILRNPDSI